MPSVPLRGTVSVLVCTVAALIVLTLGSTCAYSAGAVPLLKVGGEATVAGVGSPARATAIARAERDALRKHIESLMGKDLMHLAGPLLNRTSAYVQSSRLVELAQGEREVHVEIVAYISPEPLRADLAALVLPALPKPPVVLVLVGEQAGNVTRLSGTEASVAETSFVKAFDNAGFEVLDPYVLRERYTQPQLMRALRERGATAARLARQNRADLILMGNAHYSETPVGTSGGTWRVSATLRLSLVNAETGKEVQALTSTASLNSGSIEDGRRQAVLDAGAKIVDDAMVGAVLAVVGKKNADIVWLAIEGPGNRRRAQEIVAVLRRFKGMTALEEMYHSPGVARYRCQYEGSMKDFIVYLTEEARYSDFSLESRIVSGQEATLTLSPNAPRTPPD